MRIALVAPLVADLTDLSRAHCRAHIEKLSLLSICWMRTSEFTRIKRWVDSARSPKHEPAGDTVSIRYSWHP